MVARKRPAGGIGGPRCVNGRLNYELLLERRLRRRRRWRRRLRRRPLLLLALSLPAALARTAGEVLLKRMSHSFVGLGVRGLIGTMGKMPAPGEMILRRG